jgi:hypothetical protein
MCVAEPTKLSLWRPNKDEAATLSIRSASGKVQTVAWAAGKATVAWPGSLPVASGAEYQIDTGGADKSSVSFVRVASAPTDIVGAAKVLIDNGCQNQLDLLVDNASKTAAPQ